MASIISILNNSSATASVAIFRNNVQVSLVEIESEKAHSYEPIESVPEANSAGQYARYRIEVQLEGGDKIYSFWQNGDEIYYSLDGSWNDELLMEFEPPATPGDSDINLKISEKMDGPWTIGGLIQA